MRPSEPSPRSQMPSLEGLFKAHEAASIANGPKLIIVGSYIRVPQALGGALLTRDTKSSDLLTCAGLFIMHRGKRSLSAIKHVSSISRWSTTEPGVHGLAHMRDQHAQISSVPQQVPARQMARAAHLNE